MIDDTTTDTAAIYEDHFDAVLCTKLQDQVFEPIRTDAANDDRQYQSGIHAAPRINHAAVIAKSRYVHAHYQWVSRMRFDFPDHGRFNKVSRNKLQRACGRELTAHPSHKKVAVLGVILCPLANLFLVGNANIARVHVPLLPTMREPSKALTERTYTVKRIAKHGPHDLSIHVGHHRLDRLPDDRRDHTRFVHDHQNP